MSRGREIHPQTKGARGMIHSIGTAAGKIWHYLQSNGQSSFSNIVKGTKLKEREANRAIGWLAREGKIHFAKDKNRELISLAEG
jgi:hypothetical protein